MRKLPLDPLPTTVSSALPIPRQWIKKYAILSVGLVCFFLSSTRLRSHHELSKHQVRITRNSCNQIIQTKIRIQPQHNDSNLYLPPLELAIPTLPLPYDTPLDIRLKELLSAPILDLEFWKEVNERTCTSRMNVNLVHERRSEAVWATVTEDKIREVRNEITQVLREAQKLGRLREAEIGDSEGGRGIVFTAGNSDTVRRVILSLKLLRSYGTELPAELWHYPSEVPLQEEIEILASLNCTLRSATLAAVKDSTTIKNFQIKGTALVHSRFDELLYLDSDSLPIRAIDDLFDSPGYKRLGAIFWMDYWKDSASNPIWAMLGMQCRNEWTQESGQIVINRKIHLDALILVEYFLSNREFWFNFSDGDKDLFRFAFLFLRKDWAVPGRNLSPVSFPVESWTSVGEFCGTTMLQYDPWGRPLFVHQNLIKRIIGIFVDGTAWGRSQIVYSSFNRSTLGDGDTSANQLANVDDEGFGIGAEPSSLMTRERALLERGVYTTFHEGERAEAYVICADNHWNSSALESVANKSQIALEAKQPKLEIALELKEDCNYPALSIDWKAMTKEPIRIMAWSENEWLKDFETRFFSVGGVVNGVDF